jgi:hypothetical protein
LAWEGALRENSGHSWAHRLELREEAYSGPLSRLQAGMPASWGASCCRCRLSAVGANRELTETIWRHLGIGGLARFMKQLLR